MEKDYRVAEMEVDVARKMRKGETIDLKKINEIADEYKVLPSDVSKAVRKFEHFNSEK